jgi:hypothetical protein
MAYYSYTYTLVNATTADASQVMQNFTDALNGISDGTKDINVNAITAAGAASITGAATVGGALSVTGNVTLGNASSKDVTITGSLASSIPIKTTATYDIGDATHGLRAAYLGLTTFTTKLATAVTTSYTFTFPAIASAKAGMSLVSTDTASSTIFRYPDKALTSQTTTYTTTTDETFIPCNATSAAFTVTLIAASGMSGKKYIIKKTDSSVNAVTIDGNASETIDGGLTTTLNTQYESVEIVCDGSNWHTVNRTYPSVWTSYTPTITGCGTVTSLTSFYRRAGDSIQVMSKWVNGTVATSLASVSLPTGLALDTAKLLANTTSNPGQLVGHFTSTGNSCSGSIVTATSTSTAVVYFANQFAAATLNLVPQNGSVTMNDSVATACIFTVPISGWK